jgi:hypothetical protein
MAAVLAGCGRREGKSGSGSGTGGSSGLTDAAETEELESFWADWKKAVASGDGRALWSMTCASNRRAIIDRTRASMGNLPDSEWKVLASLTGQPEERLREMPAEMLAEETTVAMLGRMRDQPGEGEKMEKSTLIATSMDRDRGTIRFRTAEGKELSLVAVRENGAWKADLEESARNGSRK